MKLNSHVNTKLFGKGETGILTVFPVIEGMMTGVESIFHIHPRYQIRYTDGSAEETTVSGYDDDLNFQENLFSFIRVIQEQARKPQCL